MAGGGRGAGLPAAGEAAKAGRVGVGTTKRARDPSPNSKDPNGFVGVIAAEKKPALQLHGDEKYQKKAGNDPVPPTIDDTSKTGGLHLHGGHVSQSPPDSNALRYVLLH
jgi:hypothetical protein